MLSKQTQTQSDLRNDPRNLKIAKFLEMKIPVIFSPLTDATDERAIVRRLNERGHCIKLVYYPNKKVRATVSSTKSFRDHVAICDTYGEALVEAALAAIEDDLASALIPSNISAIS